MYCITGFMFYLHIFKDGPGSSVGIATGYGLDDPGIESRWGAKFSAPVQTGPGAHPISCTMGTGSFPGVKSGRGVALTLHHLLVPWSWKGRAMPLLPLGAVQRVLSLSACTRVHFTLPQCLYKGALYLISVPVQGCALPYLSACTRVRFTLSQCLYGCTLTYLSACTRVRFTLPQCLYKGALYLTSVPVRVYFTLPQCLYKGALCLTSVPVQGCTLPYLSAYTRVRFTLPQCLYGCPLPYISACTGALYLTSVPVQGCALTYLSACTRLHFTLPQCLYKGAL